MRVRNKPLVSAHAFAEMLYCFVPPEHNYRVGLVEPVPVQFLVDNHPARQLEGQAFPERRDFRQSATRDFTPVERPEEQSPDEALQPSMRRVAADDVEDHTRPERTRTVISVRQKPVERLLVTQFRADDPHQSLRRNGSHPRKMTGCLGQVLCNFAGLHGPKF